MKSIFYCVFAILIVLSSSCEIDPKLGPGDVVDVSIDFIIRNINGENLFEDNTDKKIMQEEIRIYFVENGIEREIFNPKMDSPRSFHIYDDQNYGKIFSLTPIDNFIEGMKKVIIKWNSIDKDTIDAKILFKKINNGTLTYCDSVWVNGVLKFPNLEFHPSRKFILVK